MPDSVVGRAKQVLKELTEGQVSPFPGYTPHRQEEDQLSLAGLGSAEVIEMIRSTDLNTLTPIEALNLLYSWKKKVQEES